VQQRVDELIDDALVQLDLPARDHHVHRAAAAALQLTHGRAEPAVKPFHGDEAHTADLLFEPLRGVAHGARIGGECAGRAVQIRGEVAERDFHFSQTVEKARPALLAVGVSIARVASQFAQ
jgi:hypothetical protein